MKFRADRPIFQQIVEHVEELVVSGNLSADERAPAVRELALELEVNPNTVVRSFLELEQAGVLYKKRGLGSFVSSDAKQTILSRRRREFVERELPEVARKMRLLGVELDVLKKIINETERDEP